MRGFVLVLVVSGEQAEFDHDAIARVMRDYDVATLDELEQMITTAARQTIEQMQMRLRARLGLIAA